MDAGASCPQTEGASQAEVTVSRRQILQFSATLLGPGILDFLRTPTWRWSSLPILQASTVPIPSAESAAPKVQFVDVAREAGLTTPNVWGGVDRKSYIIEAKGSGIAFFDYDQDGWLDIYLTNGTRLNTTWPPGQAPTTQLYHNNRDGTFTDVTANPASPAPAGKPASASATSITTAGTTCFVPFGGTTFYSTITGTAPSPT